MAISAELPRMSALTKGTCAVSTLTSVLTNVILHTIEVNSKMAQGRCKKTNFVFDHFGANITTEHNSQKAIKWSVMYQPH